MQYTRFFAFVLVAVVVAVTAVAQVSVNTSSDSRKMGAIETPTDCASVHARVLTSDGRPESGASVELRSLDDGTVQALDGSLASSLNDCIKPGWYRAVAQAGMAYAAEDVQVVSGDQTVTLRLDGSSTASGGATVSTASLLVPGKARNALRKARELIVKARYADSLHWIEKALQIYPQSSEAYQLRGMVSMLQHQGGSALADFQRAIRLDANNALPRIMVGSVLNDQQRYNDALTALTAALPLAPNSWQLDYELGRAYAGVGRLKDALRVLTRAIQINPDFAALRLARGMVLLHTRDFADASADLDAFLHTNPSPSDAKAAQQMLAEAKAGQHIK